MTEFCHREGFKGGGVGANIKDYIKYNITDIEEIQPDLETYDWKFWSETNIAVCLGSYIDPIKC